MPAALKNDLSHFCGRSAQKLGRASRFSTAYMWRMLKYRAVGVFRAPEKRFPVFLEKARGKKEDMPISFSAGALREAIRRIHDRVDETPQQRASNR